MALTPQQDLVIAICGTVAGNTVSCDSWCACRRGLTKFSGILSMLGSLSIIAMYTHQHIRKQTMFYQKLVLYLSISDLLWNLTTTINQVYYIGILIAILTYCSFGCSKLSIVFRTYEYPHPEECISSGFIQQWFEVASDFWIATMSISQNNNIY